MKVIKKKSIIIKTRKNLLLEKFDIQIFDLDLDTLIENFSRFLYRSPLRFFIPGFYRDKRIILQASRSASLPHTILENLLETRELVRLNKELESKRPRQVEEFGYFDEREETDFERIKRAVVHAKQILQFGEFMPFERVMEFISQPIVLPLFKMPQKV